MFVGLLPTTERQPWDLQVALSALQHEPFDPVETVGLKWLSLKSVFLLAFVSVQRMGGLHALLMHGGCCCFWPADAGVSSVELHPSHPSQDDEAGLSGQSLLCPEGASMV